MTTPCNWSTCALEASTRSWNIKFIPVSKRRVMSKPDLNSRGARRGPKESYITKTQQRYLKRKDSCLYEHRGVGQARYGHILCLFAQMVIPKLHLHGQTMPLGSTQDPSEDKLLKNCKDLQVLAKKLSFPVIFTELKGVWRTIHIAKLQNQNNGASAIYNLFKVHQAIGLEDDFYKDFNEESDRLHTRGII